MALRQIRKIKIKRQQQQKTTLERSNFLNESCCCFRISCRCHFSNYWNGFWVFFQISYIPTKWNRQIRPWQGMLQMSAYRLNRLYKWGFHRFDLTKAYKVICWIDFLLYYSSLTLANDFKMLNLGVFRSLYFFGKTSEMLALIKE